MKRNIGCSLPVYIPEPNWYVDPTHRAKCLSGDLFDLVNHPKPETQGNELDAFACTHTTHTI